MGLIVSTSAVVARQWVEGLFSSFRTNGLPTLYPPNKTAVTADVLEVGFIYAVGIIAFSFFIILPGIRGWERLYCFVRVTVSLFIGAVIMLGIWGNGWEVGHIHTRTQYRAFTGYEIEANIGLKIGLHNMNITLVGTPIEQLNETINYNERFWWSFPWNQGRNGFGRFAGEMQQEFRAAQYKGLPYPILWVAEYFTFDGEGIRWGRHYRHAGFYTHIVLWMAFPLWLLSNALFFMVPRNGAFFLFLTGLCMTSGNVIYATYRNPTELEVPFEDATLKLSWGINFWLNLLAGVFSLIIALFIFLFGFFGFDSELATFFGTDELRDMDEYYLDDAKDNGHQNTAYHKGLSPQLKSNPKPSPSVTSEDDLLARDTGGAEEQHYGNEDLRRDSIPTLKKRGYSSRFSKARAKKPRPAPRRRPAPTDVISEEDEGEDDEMYENVAPGGVVRFSTGNGAHPEEVTMQVS